MKRFALLVSLAASLLLAPAASAVSLVTPDGHEAQPYQRWADTAKVPTPPGQVTVWEESCAYGEGSCVVGDTRNTIYLEPGAGRNIFLHELGHVYDARALRGVDRYRFMTLAGVRRDWWVGVHDDRLGEWFAGAYSLCAVMRFSRRDLTRWFTPDLMNWHPTGRTLARTCTLISHRTPRRPTASYSWL